ncbi:diguanylate cyclase domain-containing protein, partial [Sulfuricurvum sp.]|uniref:diguanylate cyclase domain-containing protein n=1 Tax=Sulfuricurvum sp. TaxID=2025608 RepID=UPI003BB8140A
MLLSDLVVQKNDCIDVDASLHEAIDRMGKEGISHVILIKNEMAVGVLTLKNIIDLYHDGIEGEVKAIVYANYPVISLHDNRPTDMAVELMIDYEIRRLILVDENEKYIATLLQSDILSYFESKIHTAQEVFQCLNRRNKAVGVAYDASVYDAVTLMQDEHKNVLIVMQGAFPLGIVTEQDILDLAYRNISSKELISHFMHTPIITVELNEKVHHAIEIMKERDIHHLMVKGRDEHFYLLSEKDLVLNYNTALEIKLEAKLRDSKATYNLLGLAFCEIVDIGEDQIIRWLNAEAMITFQIKIDDSASKIFPDNGWDFLMDLLRKHGGVDKEKIEIGERVYEVTLIEAEVNDHTIMKLFLNDISELVRLNEELRKSLEYSIELEKEKSGLYLNVAAVMCMALDKEGNIELINPKGCEILGITQEEVIGKNWFDTFVVYEQSGQSKEVFYEIMSAQREMIDYFENKIWTKNGEERVIAWHNAIIKDNEGIPIGSFSSGEDITRLQESEREIERMTHYDVLTNLPNRLLLNARLKHSIERSDREKTKLAVIYIDIDNFKDINESYGYTVGDALIVEIASKMDQVIRREDTIARIGGDEFIIVMEALQDMHECDRVIKAIIGVFEESIVTQESDFLMTVSMGITIYPQDGEDAQTLLKNADIALRRAKEAGGSNYCYFAQEMSVQLFERVLMERELRRAIEEKEFIVYYQPQVDLVSLKVIGAEALVRWQHPSQGIIRPDIFIPLAESNHLIVPIGEQVLAQSCAFTKRLIDEGLFHGRISVNVSGKQFDRPDAVETLSRIIDNNGLAHQYVELEITESVLMNNPKVLGEKLMALKALGIEVAIDDFG